MEEYQGKKALISLSTSHKGGVVAALSKLIEVVQEPLSRGTFVLIPNTIFLYLLTL